MNTKVPILDVVVILAVTGAALSPWSWSALIVAAVYFAVLAYVIDERTPPADATDAPTGEGEG